MADRDFANGAPHRGQFRAAIRVLEAAGKVDKAKSIEALNGYFAFLAQHGFTKADPLVVSAMALLNALPDGGAE
jgi:hypothetical protein